MSLIDPTDAIVITTIGISGSTVEIGYLEKDEQIDSVGLMRTIFIDTVRTNLTSQFADLMDAAVDLVEGGLLALRNPEPQFDPRKRLRGRAPENES